MTLPPYVRILTLTLLISVLGVEIKPLSAQFAPSSYLSYSDAESGDIVMTRIQVQMTTPSTFFETMGGNAGENGGWYCGIQDSGSLGKNYIFSLWDPVSGGETSTAVYWNPSGTVSRFSGESTGIHYLNYNLPWKPGNWYRLVARAWDYQGKTYYGLWSYDETARTWIHHAVLAFPATGLRFATGTSSFLEDWAGTGQNERRSEYSDGWKRSTSSAGGWVPYSSAVFSEGGSGQYTNAYDAGVQSGAYYMQTGGSTVPTLSDDSTLQIDFPKNSPSFPVGQIDSVTSSYDQSANQISVSWTTEPTKSPQFSYKVDVFTNPGLTGSPILTNSDVVPQIRSIVLNSPTPDTSAYYVRVSITDIFDQTSVPVSVAVAGTGPSALQFLPVVPCRIADTRNSIGAFGGPELDAGATRTFDIPQSDCGIPSTAVAYSLNVTAVPNVSLGYLTIWPAGGNQPYVSTLNSDGRVKANAAIVPAATSGGVSIFASDATQVILDIDGYFVPAGKTSALAFYPVTPCRVADTRNANGPQGGPSLGAASSRSFPVQGICNIPSTAQAYSLNITAVPDGDLGYLTT